jgi:hypothetical protein
MRPGTDALHCAGNRVRRARTRRVSLAEKFSHLDPRVAGTDLSAGLNVAVDLESALLAAPTISET